ncbi:MAG: hypothetical protein DWQ04_18415 [Chloroflexi bacterium]|nr:MAG: hypothetical protein DWQ04_18415 [Chloroflexota bacterium]
MVIKRGVPVLIAVFLGILTLLGLVVPLPEVNRIVLNWASFIAAAALLLGILNLFNVHSRRLFKERNLYSGVLILSMLAVFALAITDSPSIAITENGVNTIFKWVQAPLESALTALLAFVLLITGFQMLRNRRNGYAFLFLLTAMLVLLANVLTVLTLVPAPVRDIVEQFRRLLEEVVVTAGMRGILLGIALGTITLSIRLLLGMERPYNK